MARRAIPAARTGRDDGRFDARIQPVGSTNLVTDLAKHYFRRYLCANLLRIEHPIATSTPATIAMKTKYNRFLVSSLAAVAALSSSAFAQTITKADNTTALGTGTSWTGGTAPGSGNVADWSGTYNTAGSLSAALPGSALSWQGISIGSLSGTAAGLVSIGGTAGAVASSNLTIGTSGIDMSAANQNLVINAATIVATGNQTWNIGTGRNLRLGTTGGGAGNANLDGTATITVSGSGLVDANQGGVSGFADAAGYAGFSGKWQINSGATLRGLRNGATAWGTSTAADAITLNGGTLAVGGISGTQGNWTWNNPITLSASTTSSIDQQIFSGTGRSLKLMGAITGDATTNLVFKETGAIDSFSGDDLGYIIAVDNPGLAGTVTIWGAGATENNIANRLTSVRVGGVNGATDVATGAGAAGTLGTATIVNNGVLTLSRSDTWTFANSMSGSGSLRIGGGVTGAGTQIVTVSGNNTHSGGTALGSSGVTLRIANTNALGSGTFTIAGSGVFDNNTGGALTIANALAISGGSPTFTGTNDMTINGAVTLSGITAGQTRTITVSANTLTLGNAISESVAGLGLTKAGPGTLTLSSASSSFTGQVTLAGGQTNIAKLANTGTNSSLGAGNAAYTIRLNGGTLNYTGTGGDTTDRTVQMQASGAINNNGDGTIAFTAPSVTHFGTATARNLTLGGTYSGGANTFGSVISDSGTGTNLTSLIKNGASLWTLGAANTYTGTTTVNAGTLEIGAAGSLASTVVNVTGGALKPANTVSGGFANNTAITVSSGALLDLSSAASFALGSNMTLNAGRTSSPATDVNGTLTSGGTVNPAANGTKGTLSVAGGISLTGGNLNFDLTSGDFTSGGGVNDLITATGALNLSGTTTVNVTWTGAIQPGTYTLISGASLGSGGTANLATGAGLVGGGRSAFAFDTTTTPGSVLLTVTGAPASLKWVGDGGTNQWDINTTANWNNGSGADNYLDLDYLTFDDTSANGAVSLGVTVAPGSVTFNNSTTAYSISGAGKISGSTTLTKNGSASVTLATANDYTGGTTLASGTLSCGTDTALGSGTLNLNGGTLSSDSAAPRALANPVLAGGDATLGDAVNNGALTLSGTFNLGGSTRQLTVPSDVTLSGALSNGGLTKAGTGTLVLSATNSYTGATTVSGGILQLSGSGAIAPGSAITVNSGTTLDYAVGNQTVGNAITNNGSVTRSTGGTGNLYFSNTGNTGTGSWGCNAGFIGFNTVASLGSTTAINLNGGGIYFNTNNQTVPGTITVTLGASGGSLNGSTGNTSTWNSKFTGTGGLAKVSGETAILAANNDYTGTTTLTAGTMRITGTTNTTAGAISFNGGTLQIASGGSFTTTGASSNTASAGSLNVNAGGTLSAGSMIWTFAPGTFTVDGTLNIAGALTASWNNTRSITGTGTINAGSFANNNFSVTTISVNRLNLGGNISMSNPGSITLSGTTLGAYANWTGSAPMVLAASTTNTVNTLDSADNTTARSVTLAGVLSGTGSLAKTGAGTLTLTGANTYSGATTVTGGTLALGAGNVLADNTAVSIGAATLSIGNGFSDTAGTLDPTAAATIDIGSGATLAFAASNGVDWAGGSLTITGTFVSGSSLRFGDNLTQPGLTAGQLSQISAAGFTNFALDANGFLTASPAGGFSSWATANAPGQTIDQDHDDDGVPNGVEYFMGLSGSGFTSNPTPNASNVISWPKGASYTGTYGTDFVIQISSDLGLTDPWTNVPSGNVTINADSVDYDLDTVPAGTRKFARLVVTGP